MHMIDLMLFEGDNVEMYAGTVAFHSPLHSNDMRDIPSTRRLQTYNNATEHLELMMFDRSQQTQP